MQKARCPLAKHLTDQAEGLRRLVGGGSTQIIPVMSGSRGAGKTTAVANIASALTGMGRDVLVIDDGSGANGVCNSLGMQAHRCLTDVMAGRCSLEEVIVHGHNGMRILPMGMRYRAMTEGSSSLPVPLDVWALQVHPAPDVVLIDLPGGIPALSQDGLRKSEVVITMLPGSESIMSGYALMKRLSRDHGIGHFHILLNRLARPEDGEDIARNVVDTAAEFLGVRVSCMGFIQDDARLAQAGRLSQPVVDAYPVAPSSRQFKRVTEGLLRWPPSLQRGGPGNARRHIAMGFAG
jgi:flagellar biosynthesis protein FlhG